MKEISGLARINDARRLKRTSDDEQDGACSRFVVVYRPDEKATQVIPRESIVRLAFRQEARYEPDSDTYQVGTRESLEEVRFLSLLLNPPQAVSPPRPDRGRGPG